ncbi:HECTD2 [Bugula neritina]|uniref:HECT-type E3 ubiquitin transferase n=1 Tax=Bugula neritina TaxID=10212 RepID=A0A7J7KCC3_BUGNE|nr:HECTD2 [Bugula neritina]
MDGKSATAAAVPSTVTTKTCSNFLVAARFMMQQLPTMFENFKMAVFDTQNPDQLRDRYAKLHRDKMDKESMKQQKSETSSGPLQSIANFFNNIGSSKKSQKLEFVTLPAIDQNGGSLTGSAGISPRPPSTPRDAAKKSRGKERVPERNWTCSELKHLYKTAKDTENWTELSSMYSLMFHSFAEVNATFKKAPQSQECDTTEESGIQLDLVETVYEILKKAPSDVQKAVLKSIINCLLSDKGLSETTKARVNVGKDELRAYLIFSLNPLFQNVTTFVIFAHLLRQISSLSDQGHHFLVHWYKSVSVEQFRSLVQKLNKFISLRLFPENPTDLPPMSKCQWWIPSCCKVLALLNATSNLMEPPKILHTDFYNEILDNVDLLQEYKNWQNPEYQGGFSFCQYPFLITISGKRTILQKDSETQMIQQAEKTIKAVVQQRQKVDMDNLFLNLNVRRKHIVSDSLVEIAKHKFDLKKKLKVTFVGEPGLDLGGLTKEWFLILLRDLFRPEYGMFVYTKSADTYWFSLHNRDAKLKEFNLIGVLMGLAVYNGINLDIRLPFIAYKKLLSPAVVPCNNPNATVGVIPKPSIYDLESVMPDVAHSLKELLEYDGDVEEDLCLTFQASIGQNQRMITEELVKGGAEMAVTNENRQGYVDLYLDWILNKSIYLVFRAFYHGFHSVCASNALLTLKPVEVEVLVLWMS